MARAFSDDQIEAALAAVDNELRSQRGGNAGPGTGGAAANATLISAAPTNGGEDELLTVEVVVKG